MPISIFSSRASLIALVSLGAVASANAALIPLGLMNGRNFFVTDVATDATTARSIAASVGGTLASVRNQQEQDFLTGLLSGTGSQWIGFSDELSEGNFVWDDGWTGTYTNWAPGEPNNYNPGTGEHNVVINWTNDGKWNDLYKNYDDHRAIITTTAVPEPASIAALCVGAIGLLRRRSRR